MRKRELIVRKIELRGRGPAAIYFTKSDLELYDLEVGKRYRIIIEDLDDDTEEIG